MWKDEAEQREGRQFHQEVKMLGQQQGITLIRARSGRSYFLIFLCRGEDGFRKELEKLVGEQNPLRVGSEDLAGGESWRWHIMKSLVRGLAGSSGPANTGVGGESWVDLHVPFLQEGPVLVRAKGKHP